MRDSIVGRTVFVDVDLRGVQGLDMVQHSGPSSIGIDTLYRSEGDIPEVFLRGCGVPDSMIEYARSLVLAERSIDYYSVFISYNSTDQACAERLHADLQSKGVRCSFAPHDMKIGDSIIDRIDQAIRLHEKLLVILSATSVASNWVAMEVKTALMREQNEGRRVLFLFASMTPCCIRRAPGRRNSAPVTSATSEAGRTTTATRRRSRGCSGI